MSTSDANEEKEKFEEINELNQRLQTREAEVIDLQKKVIDLYEQLHKK
nr:hypothetical protein [Sphingobacterium composti Ten et al. 2007 non Yoo et al. 2007]